MKNSARLAAFALVTLSATLMGCTTTPSKQDAMADTQAHFTCDRGEDVTVRFLADNGHAVLIRNGQEIHLHPQPSASGFVYSNGPNTIRGKGDELRIEIGRMMPIVCKAK